MKKDNIQLKGHFTLQESYLLFILSAVGDTKCPFK